MLRFIELLAEEAIQRAMREGQFDGLPGRGKPLPDEDLCHVPPELRMAYKILKNAGCLPPELEAEKEILNVADMLAGMRDEEERHRQMQKLNALMLRAGVRRGRAVNLEMEEHYYRKVVERIRVRPRPGNKA